MIKKIVIPVIIGILLFAVVTTQQLIQAEGLQEQLVAVDYLVTRLGQITFNISSTTSTSNATGAGNTTSEIWGVVDNGTFLYKTTDTFTGDLTVIGNINTSGWTNSTFFNGTYYGDGSNLLTSTTYLATTIQTDSGVLDDGNVTSTQVINDEESYNVSEAAGADPLIIIANFTGVTNFDSLIIRMYYVGGQGHEIQIQLWDWTGSKWDTFSEITDTNDFVLVYTPVINPSDYISSTNVSLRLNHEQNGIASHDLLIDYVSIVSGFTTLTTSDHDSLSGRDSSMNHPWAFPRDGSKAIVGNVNFSGNDLTEVSDINVSDNVTANFLNGQLVCSDIYGGTDGDFCADADTHLGNTTGEIWNVVDNGTFLLDTTDVFTGDLSITGNLNVTANATVNFLNGQVVCSDIYGGSDANFCADATGAAGAGNTTEEMQDACGALSNNGDGTIMTYLDVADTLTVDLITCSGSEILKHTGAAWACDADDNTGNTTDEVWDVVDNGTFLLDTTDTFTGDLSVTGKINVTQNVTADGIRLDTNTRIYLGKDDNSSIYFNGTALIIEG